MPPFSRQKRPRLQAGTAFAIKAAAVLLTGWACWLLAAGRASTAAQPAHGSKKTAGGDALRLALSQCAPYGDVVQAATEREHPPQLNQAQLLWIAALVQGAAAARRRPADVLVFGVGLDSDIHVAVNCGGRTAFLENYQDWIDTVKEQHPGLEVYRVGYKGRMEEADAFFSAPWMMEVPEAVGRTCWDVILVDAPQGYEPTGQPGRMESSYFAMQNAKRCIAAGEVEEVVVLLHDVNRPMEQRILRELFAAPDGSIQAMGVVRGNFGDLAAFRVGKPAHEQL